ncbi:MAG TPA: sigma-54 dependent transcriptional regulator [Thermoanaerobaculia bacterium]|jgi:DNA-binding NtrC family response regulator|nr:sigma-54 dependent transcriptional regulator [Thermoanaerobaculia bacterium]
MASGRVLIVEDRDSLRRMLERALGQEGYEVTAAADGRAGIRLLGERPFDFVLTDLKLPDVSGLEVLEASRAAQPSVPVVVLTGFGTVGTAVEAMKLGAYDFLEKPLEIDDLSRLIERAVSERSGQGDAAVFRAPGAPPIVGCHPLLRAALRLLQRVGPKESTVLLTGESGTGKELFARAIHALSPRREGPCVALNCAAIPESLIENELFGHEKGAFTGADRRQPGRFELAQGGTLFLDEIGELPLGVQGKVLRALEERTFERVGGGRTMRADARLVAATNRDLAAMVEEGEFRADLFFRLNVFPIELPPLRERSSDVPLLARHLLGEIARRHHIDPPPRLEEGAAELLAGEPWPGNVRELANVLERAVILTEGPAIRAADVKPLLRPLTGPAGSAGPAAATERDRIKQALTEADGDKRRAAEILGVSYRSLLRKVKEHDLEGVPRYRE